MNKLFLIDVAIIALAAFVIFFVAHVLADLVGRLI